MKLNAWLVSLLIPVTAVSVLGQTPPPAPPPVPPPAVSAEPAPETPAATPEKPAVKTLKKKAKSKPKHKAAATSAASLAKANSVIILNPPVTANVKCDVLDVRGQGSFTGEVIGHVKKGETVTVLEEDTLNHPHPHEPAQWSRIVMPTNIEVWVSGQFVDPATKTVRVKKVNLRGGPGENFSVLGTLEKGATVAETSHKSGWLKIEAPTNASAFVASEYLEKGEAAPLVAAAPTPAPEPVPQPAPPPAPTVVTAPEPPPAPVAAGQPPAPTGNGLSAPAPTPTSQADQEQAALRRSTPAEPAVTPPAPAPPSAPGVGEESPRVVTREGFVRRSYNIQSPMPFELHDIKTGDLTEYLEVPTPKKFKAYLGTRLHLTGSEYLDPRWPRTPILKIQTVDLMP